MPLTALAALFEETAAVACGMLDLALAEPLHEIERAHVARAATKRRTEFAAGRTCARRALVRLGFEPASLPARADRSVAWPEGALGSITHTEGFAAAAVARAAELAGVGLDVERRRRLGEALWERIARPAEIGWIRAAGSEARDRAARLFSAKESFYKAQHAISATFLGFHAVRYEERGERFLIHLEQDVPALHAFGERFEGRWACAGALILTAVEIPR